MFVAIANFIIAQQKEFSVNQLTGIDIKQDKTSYNLKEEVYEAFLKMQKAAFKQDIRIEIISGFRSFNRQKQIFLKKYKKYKALGFSEIEILNKITEYSTIPGTSRHHWGTDIDIVQKLARMPKNLLTPKNFDNEGPFCKMKEWMDKNAHQYGFYLVYTSSSDRKGFKYEPWHYTYAPISKEMLKQFLRYNSKKTIYNTIKKKGVQIDSVFYNDYIKTHIKGINYQLLTP